MTFGQRTFVVVIGLLASLLATGAVPAAAQAPLASPASVAVAEPTTSPAPASKEPQCCADAVGCGTGYACAAVPYGNAAFVFRFYRYGTYGLSNWFGRGAVLNTQTGGAAMRLLDRNRVQLACYSPGAFNLDVDWNPIWYIRLTSSNC